MLPPRATTAIDDDALHSAGSGGAQRFARRGVLRAMAGASLGALLAGRAAGEAALVRRTIPATAEALPVIGLGSWQTVREDNAETVRMLLERFHAAGARVVDTSPMYGHAETVLGRAARAAGLTDTLFLATKIWTDGEQAGAHQLTASRRLLGKGVLDLVQVHNLRDWRTHLATLRAARERGELRYIGITHYQDSAHPALEEVLRTERLDFLQCNYNILDRHAEQRLLPAAAERGVAVLVNRPFGQGALFRRVRGKPLPPWAAEAGIASWGQYFLKWILAHPAVSCVIPATSRLQHLEDNLGAGRAPFPDTALRQQMHRHVAEMQP